jgi:hypothetical protein
MPSPLLGVGGGNVLDYAQVPNIVGHFKADDEALIGLADGATFATWPDAHGSNDVTQGTAGSRPAWRNAANGINGRPAVSFDGGDSMLSAVLASMADLTIFAVMRTSSDVATARSWAAGSSNGATPFVQTGTFRMNAGSVVNSAIVAAASTNYVLTAQFNQAASFIRANGSQSANVNPGSQAPTVLSVGLGGGVFWNTLIGELIFCSEASSAGVISYVEGYLNRKWGIF